MTDPTPAAHLAPPPVPMLKAEWRIVAPPARLPLARKVPGFTRALRRAEPWLTGFAIVLGWAVAVRCGLQLLAYHN